jgi:uncharacterized DUF497 family protein
MALRWTWDPDKAAENVAKHGLSFETAVLAFEDSFHDQSLTHIRTTTGGGRSASSGRWCCS